MKSIIRWTVENSPAVNTLIVTVMVVGSAALLLMQRETFPEFELDMILVSVPYPGARPAEVEEGICQKLEEAVQPIAGIKKVTSVAQEGLGYAVIQLEAHVADSQRVLNEVRSKIDRIPSFPEQAEDPDIIEVTFRLPAIRLAVKGPERPGGDAEFDAVSEIALRELAEKIRDDLLQLKTVSQANLLGAKNYQIDVEISEDTLRKHGLSLQQVAQIVRRQNIELPGGSMRTDSQEVLLRGKNKRSLGEEIALIPLMSQPNGVVLTIGELGEVRDEFDDTPSLSRVDGVPAQVISVDRTADEDLLAIVADVKKFVSTYPLPAGYELQTFQDQSIDVQERMTMLTNDGLQGLFLVFLVLAIFLDLRLAFWVSMGMPVAILGAAIYLYLAGHTLNMLTMFGFMMALGIVVDDAIVIGDNVHAHLQRGASLVDAAVNGTFEVLPSIMASVATATIAFMPMLFVSGIMGKFIAVLPVGVIATLIVSIVETTFTLPCHLAHKESLLLRLLGMAFYPLRPLHRLLKWLNVWSERGLERLSEKIYIPLVTRVLQKPWLAISVSVATLIVTSGFIKGGITPWVVFPKMDNSAILAKIAFTDGTPLRVTDEATKRVEDAIRRVGEKHAANGQTVVKLIHRRVGQVTGLSSGGPEAPTYGSHVGLVEVELEPAGNRAIKSDVILAEWRAEVGEISGTDLLTFGYPSFGPGGTPVEFKLLAPKSEMPDLERAVEECKRELATKRGVFDVADDCRPGKWEYQLQIRDHARAMGVTAADLAETVRASYYGEEVMRLQRGRHEVKLMVRYPRAQRRSLSDFEEIRVRTTDAAERPLTELAEINIERGYSELNRLDRMRCITISADIDEAEGNASQVVSDLQANFMPSLLEKFPNIRVRWEGQQEQTNESIRSLAFGFGAALLGMFVVLTLEFRSYFQPFLVMIIIPYGFVGAVWGHALLGLPITLFSVFGLVALTGVMVNDSIVLIDFINGHVREGMPLMQAVVEAGRQRMRPILLNSATTIIGLVPLLMDRSFQAQAVIPMAVSMAFGQMLSTTIVLLLMPSFYLICVRFAEWLSGLFSSPEQEFEHGQAVSGG